MISRGYFPIVLVLYSVWIILTEHLCRQNTNQVCVVYVQFTIRIPTASFIVAILHLVTGYPKRINIVQKAFTFTFSLLRNLHVTVILERQIILELIKRFEFLTAVMIPMLVFSVLMPYGLVSKYQRCFRNDDTSKRWCLSTSPHNVTAQNTNIDNEVLVL